jgi:signal transduction histidine kinase
VLTVKPNTVVTLPNLIFRNQKTFGDGILWIWKPGFVYKLNPLLPKFKKVTAQTQPDFDRTIVRGFMMLNDSILRINLDNNQLTLYNRKSNRIVPLSASDYLNAVGGRTVRTRDGMVWIMSSKGLGMYLPRQNKITYFFNSDTLHSERNAANQIQDIFEINSRQLLLSTEAGVFVFDRLLKTYHRIAPFSTDSRAVLAGHDGKIYICTKGQMLHVGYLKGAQWQPVVPPLPGYRFRNGVEDTLNQQILGATVGGLKVKDWSMKTWTTEKGLANHYIYDVTTDPLGYIWVSTNRGLSRINPKTEEINNFQLSDGLQGWEFNSRTLMKSPNGELFFGGTKGFNYFSPEDIRFNTHPPKAILTQFLIKEQPYALTTAIGEAKELHLDYKTNSFSITYSAIDYFSNGQNTYQYRLLGMDSTWVQAQQQTTARFIQVPAGHYTFELKAANNDGIWQTTPTRLRIYVSPQYWETVWFRAAMLGLLLMGIYGFYRYRLYQLVQQQHKEISVMVQTQEEERRRFSQDLHDGLGANLSALKMVLGLLQDPTSETIKTKSQELLNASIDDLRQLIHAMSPRSLTRLGLVKTVRELSIIINEAKHINIAITDTNFPENLPSDLQVNLFRIVQELLQNTIKHAQATQITILFGKNDTHLILHFTDNGRGFDPQIASATGYGLQNLYTRAQLLNAALDIQSVVGRGTTARLEVPLQ